MLNFLKSKGDLVAKYGSHSGDSGSVFVQVALLSARIEYLSRHSSSHRKDHAAKRSLVILVKKRRKLLEQSFRKSHATYSKLVSDFNLRHNMVKKDKKS